MRGLKITGKSSNGLLASIDNNIYDIGKLCHSCCGKHILVDGVMIQNTGAGIRAVDKLGAVVAHDGDSVRNTGQDALSASGKTGEEMRLNEAFRYQELCFHRQFVDDAVGTAGE